MSEPHNDDAPYSVTLNIGIPPHSEYTLEVAEALAEAVRVLNHHTMHHEALRYPSDADRVLRELSSAASRLPQLLDQIGAWLTAEHEAGCIRVPGGEWAGVPGVAVAAVLMRMDEPRALAGALSGALDRVASVTADMAAAGDEAEDAGDDFDDEWGQ